jgi:DNA-binding CsgD family transcriptional regulator
MTAVLHGRDPELELIDAALAELATTGRGRLIVVQGDAGSGRSALAGAALALARRRAIPAGVWSGRRDQVTPLPDGPVLVAADDADLAGPAVQAALDEAVARLPGAPVLLLACTALAGLGEHAAHLLDVPGSRRLVLGDLSREATAEMLHSLFGAPPSPTCVDAIHAASHGTPAVVAAAASDARWTIEDWSHERAGRPCTTALVTWLQRHLGGAAAPAARLAYAAASTGASFDAVDAMRIAGLDGDAAGAAYDALVDRGLVTGPPAASEFRHPLVRVALERTPGLALRAELRRRGEGMDAGGSARRGEGMNAGGSARGRGATDPGSPARLEAALEAFFAGDDVEGCAVTVRDVLAGGPEAAGLAADSPVLLAAAAPLAASGRLRDAEALLGGLEAGAAATGADALAVAAGGARAYLLLASGRTPEAHAAAARALAREAPAGHAFAHAALVRAGLRAGDLEQGAEELAAAQARGPSSRAERAILAEAAADLALARGDPRAAADAAAEAGRLLDGSRLDHPAIARWRSLAVRALSELRRTGEALRMADADLARARACGAPVAVARALAALAAAGPPGPRADRLAEASALLAGGQADGERVPILAEHGEALRCAGRRAEARTVLHEALALAEASGAEAVAERARDALVAARARVECSATPRSTALTRSEQRVAELAAAGLSNRAIAEQLWVTVKTVELHLTSSYRKLGLHSRRELAAALADRAAPRTTSEPGLIPIR